MTLKEMKSRLREIAKLAKKAEGEELDKLVDEASDLESKISDAKNRERLQHIADASGGGQKDGGEAGAQPKNSADQRGKTLRAGNSVTRVFGIKNAVSSSDTVLPQHTAQDVNPTFNEVSTLLDRVKPVPLIGGESYKRGFIKKYGEGDYTTEGGDYKETDPEFGYAAITKAKITAYSEEPEEINKLAPAAYSDIIEGSVDIAIRKKLTKQILVGAGGDNSLVGIFHVPSKKTDDIIDRDTDISIAGIDENTLDNIIYEFGGDEDVEDAAVLILNKLDLKAFATCRLADGRKAYTVVNNGNTGTIDGVPYIVNSACAAVTNADTSAGDYCMAYGPLSNYELAIFSDMEVSRSTDYKFRQGQIAHKGSIFVGGNVAAYNGFLRVKKADA